MKYFRLVGDDRYELARDDAESQEQSHEAAVTDRLPDELITEAHRKHVHGLQAELKAKLLANRPVFFERLVVKLMVKMGYGGSNPNAGIHTGKPGDGGIDGIVKEDRLGLDKIYLQAKRYDPAKKKVGVDDLQQFAGAMGTVRKGVLLTTSTFTADAQRFAKACDKTISLIDGDELCRLMIEHGVGVTEVASYRVYRLDTDFFTDDE